MMNEAPRAITMGWEESAIRSAISSLDGDTSESAGRIRQYYEKRLADAQAQPPIVICHESSIQSTDGKTAYMKPPRFMHKSRIIRMLDRITRWIDPKA